MTPPVHSYRVEARNALLRSRREILTPEGIPISFTLASVGDRAAALLLDLLIMAATVVGIVLVFSFTIGNSDTWLRPLVIILIFLLANFYFAFFEVRWQGSTPGKRKLGLRVIDARGGQLEASAVLARNLMRELEVWMPLRFLIGGSAIWPDAPGWARVVAVIWTLVFMLLPLFNKDRMRAGDLIAGTRVVLQPKPVLAADLADTTMSGHQLFIPPAITAATAGTTPAVAAAVAAAAAAPNVRKPTFTFTDAQLGVYGEYELHTLESVLRDTAGADRDQTLAVVADKIQGKIGFTPRISYGQEERFLRDFYAAQRAYLEKRMLFGKRKADKYKK